MVTEQKYLRQQAKETTHWKQRFSLTGDDTDQFSKSPSLRHSKNPFVLPV